jgi:alpha-1,3-mannosyltransferase
LVGDTGPLVYPALHLYIYSALHKAFPQASLIDVGGFVPGKGCSIDTEQGDASSPVKGLLGGLVPLQIIWLGVYIATLFLTALIAKKATDGSGRPTQAYPRKGLITWRVVLSWFLKGPTPLPFLLAAISTSMRLHSIYYLRLFNDPLAMLVLYTSVWLFMSHHWKAGSMAYS